MNTNHQNSTAFLYILILKIFEFIRERATIERRGLMKEEKRIGRRDFLKSGVAGAFGSGIYLGSAGVVPGTDKNTKDEKKEPVIEYRKLGKIDYKATLLGFGAMLTDDPAVLSMALDKGVNYIDTAWGYKNGNNEVMVGKVVKNRRKDVFIVSKGGYTDKSNITKHFEDSIKRLDTDYIDCYLAHGVKKADEVGSDLILSQLEKLKKDGKIRYTGFSTHTNMTEIINAAVDTKFYDLILTRYSYRDGKELEKAIERANKAGIAVVAMKIMKFLVRNKGDGYEGKIGKGMTPFQSALRYVMDNPNIATTIPGITSFKELEENFSTMDTQLSWSDRKILNYYADVNDKLYCRGCGECMDKCPKGVNIPDNMRFLMYTDGYGAFGLGRDSYNELSPSEQASNCIDCNECVVPCAYGLDIRQDMIHTHRMLG